MNQSAPWMNNKAWINGQIRSGLSLPFWTTLFSFLMWNGITITLIVVKWQSIHRAISQFQNQGMDTFSPALLFPLLLLVNLILIPQLIRHVVHWFRFGRSYLTLDPYPGAIGGQVGGYLVLPFAYKPNMALDVQLNCIRHGGRLNYGQVGSKRIDSVQWRARANADIMPEAKGSRIRFVVDVEDGLPTSLTEKEGYHFYWSLRIQLPDEGYDEEFKIPVFARQGNQEMSSIRIRSNQGFSTPTESLVREDVISIMQSANELRLNFAPGRHGKMGVWLLLLGLIPLLGMAFLVGDIGQLLRAESLSYFSLLVDFLISLLVLLLGSLFFIGGAYLNLNSLQVSLDKERLKIKRLFLGRTFPRLLDTNQIVGFVKKVNAQIGRGAQANIYYSLLAQDTQGGEFVVGDGVQGQKEADYLLGLLNNYIDDSALKPFVAVKKQIPVWASYVLRGLKVFIKIALFALLLTFVLEFFTL